MASVAGVTIASCKDVMPLCAILAATHAIDAEVRVYDNLFSVADPADVAVGETYMKHLNPASLEVLSGCKLERGLRDAKSGDRYQFERQGYFTVDPDSTPDRLVFNRTVTLRDTWAKIEKGHRKK